jgi:photosystem II stability/assembly factor-like uncharacterized protein
MKNAFLTLFIFLGFSTFGQWQKLESKTKASFRAMDVVNKKVIWAGGTQNTVLHSKNGGKTWDNQKVGTETILDFRGIKAFDKKTAIVVSAGLAQDAQAKMFKTTDGGKSWKLVFETNQKGVFLDGIAFFDKMHGLVIGDPINNEAYVLETKDGGETWQRLSTSLFPALKAGEASFAASNSCLVTFENSAWYAFQSRMLHTSDKGRSWKIQKTNFPSGPTSGIFGLHFWSEKSGIALGGDYKDDKSQQVNLARTTDGGLTWKPMEIESNGLKESAASYKNEIIVVGTSGTSYSAHFGNIWKKLDAEPFHVVRCAGKYCYAIGANGNLAKMKF